jgi:RsmE family RNA methyltransferase
VNLILLEPEELGHDNTARLAGGRAAHVRDVLKVVPGDEIRIGLVDGNRGTAVVRDMADDAVVLTCRLTEPAPPRPPVDLLLALPRPKVLRRLFAQCTALGVDRIMLTNAARVERHYFDTHVLTPDTYRPLLIEGLQQARDTRLPLVSVHRQFRVLVEDLLDEWTAPALRVVAQPGRAERLHTLVSGAAHPRVLLAVGPEGGWNAFELSLLESRGFTPISMGTRALRSDTACVALLALAHDALDARASRVHATALHAS